MAEFPIVDLTKDPKPVIEWPRGFTTDDIASLHTLINGLLHRMLSGYDNEGNRTRTMEQEGATPVAIEWVMGSIAVPYPEALVVNHEPEPIPGTERMVTSAPWPGASRPSGSAKRRFWVGCSGDAAGDAQCNAEVSLFGPHQAWYGWRADGTHNITAVGGLTIDPFLGSGTTIIAAHLESRVCYGMEIDPRYCDVICKRYQLATGIQPVLEATGDAHDFCEEA